jgi:hypothetical protein
MISSSRTMCNTDETGHRGNGEELLNMRKGTRTVAEKVHGYESNPVADGEQGRGVAPVPLRM